MVETRRASESPRRPGGSPRGEGDPDRSAGGGVRKSVAACGGASAGGRKGAQGNQRTRTRRGEDREEGRGNCGTIGRTEEGQGRGSRARDRGQPRTPPGPGSGDCEADQGSRKFAGIPSDGQRSLGAPRSRTRNRDHSHEGGPRVGGGSIRRPRERPQYLSKRLCEGGTHLGVRPSGSGRFAPPASGSGKGGQRRTHQGTKCNRGREGKSRTPQGRGRRAS